MNYLLGQSCPCACTLALVAGFEERDVSLILSGKSPTNIPFNLLHFSVGTNLTHKDSSWKVDCCKLHYPSPFRSSEDPKLLFPSLDFCCWARICGHLSFPRCSRGYD
ncbi:hypothetical protein Tco_1244793 [Tanacetum coccineum]